MTMSPETQKYVKEWRKKPNKTLEEIREFVENPEIIKAVDADWDTLNRCSIMHALQEVIRKIQHRHWNLYERKLVEKHMKTGNAETFKYIKEYYTFLNIVNMEPITNDSVYKNMMLNLHFEIDLRDRGRIAYQAIEIMKRDYKIDMELMYSNIMKMVNMDPSV